MIVKQYGRACGKLVAAFLGAGEEELHLIVHHEHHGAGNSPDVVHARPLVQPLVPLVLHGKQAAGGPPLHSADNDLVAAELARREWAATDVVAKIPPPIKSILSESALPRNCKNHFKKFFVTPGPQNTRNRT